MFDARKCVEKGAALLDQDFPNWEERLRPAELEVGSSAFCVGGQLCGSFFNHEFQEFLVKHRNEYNFIDELGFDAVSSEQALAIKNAWIDIVRERLEVKCAMS